MIDVIKRKMQFTTIDVALFIPKISTTLITIFSNTAVTVEKLANVISTKKSVPQNLPSGILIKISGSVAKISDGPCAGSTPYAKQAGKIIIPDMIATNVSSVAMVMASPISLFSLSM